MIVASPDYPSSSLCGPVHSSFSWLGDRLFGPVIASDLLSMLDENSPAEPFRIASEVLGLAADDLKPLDPNS